MEDERITKRILSLMDIKRTVYKFCERNLICAKLESVGSAS